MRICTTTGVVRTEEMTVTKSIGELLVRTSLSIQDLKDEKISVMIERGNGNNIVIHNKIKLVDFILGSTFGASAVQSNEDFQCIAICELSNEGSIFLAEKESIKITLEELNPEETYSLNGIEDFKQTNEIYFMEQKSVASEEVNKKINVEGFDLAIMTVSPSVSDISFTHANGQVVKYFPEELEALSRDMDPIQAIQTEKAVEKGVLLPEGEVHAIAIPLVTGTVLQGVKGRLTLPLEGITWIEINKTQGTIVNFVVRTLKLS